MPAEGRRPAVVMFTDMVGYSELTQRDETEALRLLNEHRRIVRPLLARFGGREVKTIGDAFMVEFADGLSATRCALEMQRAHAERNRDLELTEVTIRVGLHAGEVIDQDGDLYGDTVNVASRIEPLAPPGGICLSEAVYATAKAGLEVAATPIGPATLKNIHLPIPVYRIDLRRERHLPVREGPWVDRTVELERLERAIAAVADGHGSVVVLAGESGVGKTRLAEQAVRSSARRGFSAVHSRAPEEGTAPPYALWTEAIRQLVGPLTEEEVRAAAGEYAADLRPLLPMPSDGATPTATDADLGTDRARDRLYAGVAQLFRALALRAPTLLILDDLQWADTASLRLLQSFAATLAETRVLVLVTHRTDPGPAPAVWKEVVSGLVRDSRATEIVVPSLDLASVRQLVLLLLKTKAVPDRFVLQIFEKTHGNPFFVEEVLRALRGQGILPGETDEPFARLPETLPLPDSVRRLVRRRLEEVARPVTEMLRAASVLGSEFSYAPLERVTGLAREPLIDRLGDAIGAGVLLEATGENGEVRYAFVDRQTWETMYGDLPASLRARYHLRAGEALETLARDGGSVPVSELAYHFQQAREPTRALRYALRAAEEAGRVSAREEAVRYYRTCLELLESRPDERQRLQILEPLADQLYRLGQLEAAQAIRTEAAEHFERLGEARAAGNLHRKIAHSMREDPESAQHHWEEALRLLETGPETPELARLYGTIAGYRYEAGAVEAARAQYGRAIEIARHVDDPSTQVGAQMVLAGLWPLADRARVFEELDEALRVARDRELFDLLPNLLMVVALARLHLRGDGASAEAALTEGVELARRVHDTYSEQALEANLGTYLAWRLGDYERALRKVEEHVRYAEGDPRKLLPVAFLVGGDIELSRGDASRARRFQEEAEGLLALGGDWSERVQLRNLEARAELARGQFANARATLGEAHALAVRVGVPALMAVLHAETLHLQVETELRAATTDSARPFLRELEQLAVGAAPSPLDGFARRASGLVARAEGDLASSADALAQALATWERIGWAYEAARTRQLLAVTVRRLGDGPRADQLERDAEVYLGRIRREPAGPSVAPSG